MPNLTGAFLVNFDDDFCLCFVNVFTHVAGEIGERETGNKMKIIKEKTTVNDFTGKTVISRHAGWQGLRLRGRARLVQRAS